MRAVTDASYSLTLGKRAGTRQVVEMQQNLALAAARDLSQEVHSEA